MKSIATLGKIWTVLGVVLSLLGAANARAQALGSYQAAALTAQTTDFLQHYVNKEGQVNYAGIQRAPEQLEELLEAFAAFDVAHVEPADQYAFYLNAYNVLVIGQIVRNYPLKSVQDIPGFFNQNQLRVGREKLTLDQIETAKLRKLYDDPRLHFALVCGTLSCSRLSRTAYAGDELFEQLNRQARLALLNPAYVKVDAAAKLVQLPEIFKWYQTDFSSNGLTGLLYVNQFRKKEELPTWYAVDYYPYNWGLNEQSAR